MTRPLILILAGLSVMGCKSQSPTADPFFGRTTIPPPPTGAATGQPCNPYQTPQVVQAPTQPPGVVCPPSVQMPSQPPAVSSTTLPSAQPQLPGFQPSPPAATAQPVMPPGLGPSYSAPRPTSTGSSAPPPPLSAPPAGNPNPYVPPGGTFNYRGVSSQGSAPLVPTQPDTRTALPSVVGVSTTRTIAPPDDRMPKPLDSAGAGVGATKPIIQTIQPRAKVDGSDRMIDIADLPKASGTAGETNPVRPVGP